MVLSIERVWVTMLSMPQPPYRVAALTRCGLVYCRESSIGPIMNMCVQAPSWPQCDGHGICRWRGPKKGIHSQRDQVDNNASHLPGGSQVDLCNSRIRG